MIIFLIAEHCNPHVNCPNKPGSFTAQLNSLGVFSRGVIQRMVLASDPRKVRQMTNGAITALESACRDRSLLSPHQGGFVYPGTKWCGPGKGGVEWGRMQKGWEGMGIGGGWDGEGLGRGRKRK